MEAALFDKMSISKRNLLKYLFLFNVIISGFQCSATSNDDSLQIVVSEIPADGIIVQQIILRLNPMNKSLLTGTRILSGNIRQSEGPAVPAVLVPNPEMVDKDVWRGSLIIYAPGKNKLSGTLLVESYADIAGKSINQVTAKSQTTEFNFKQSAGGLPNQISISENKSQSFKFLWNDRLYNLKDGAYLLRNDHSTELYQLVKNSFVTVIRSKMRYLSDKGTPAPGNAFAVYDWYFFNSSPSVYVKGWQNSSYKYQWKEAHFLEWNFPGQQFDMSEGDIAGTGNKLIGKKDILKFNNWAALRQVNGNTIALLNKARIYDDINGNGTYIHSEIPDAWAGWNGVDRSFGTWLWVGIDKDSGNSIEAAFENKGNIPRVDLTIGAVQENYSVTGRKKATKYASEANTSSGSMLTFSSLPKKNYYKAGNLSVAFNKLSSGITLSSLYDNLHNLELLSSDTSQLFSLKIRNLKTNEVISLDAKTGWIQSDITTAGKNIELRFSKNVRGIDLSILVTAMPDEQNAAWHWKIDIDNKSADWALDNVGFPLVNISNLGGGSYVLYPQGSGVLKPQPFYADWKYEGKYPSGWASMQYLSVYNQNVGVGLYIARHDAGAATKTIDIEGKNHNLTFGFYQPAENPNKAGNDFTLTGDAVWQLYTGNWFDASMIYKKWVKTNAPWWPKMGPQGRDNTPLSFKKLDSWLVVNGGENDVISITTKVNDFLHADASLGVHWYRWHEIPFDNDYPHFFPAKAGFNEGVSSLKKQRIFVMPYINGRLWDTKDSGNTDWQFSTLAKASAIKAYDFDKKRLVLSTESYNSQEAGSAKVVFAPMCPYTSIWQNTLRDVANKLYKEEGVDAVYFDQIAATPPMLCMDPTHGHPLGGGTWWVQSYNKLLQQIRVDNPGKVLTTECNAEPYISAFDGFLTWHWQFDNAVPAFPAVYAGTVVMFGRAFKGGDSKDLALRMKVAQQLTFGEQIGWIDGNYLLKQLGTKSRNFYNDIVKTRHQLQDLFYSGEMMRPPTLKFAENTRKLSADWQWSGKWIVTTDAILTGAWKKGHRLGLIFSNPSESQISAGFFFNPGDYGIPNGQPYSITSWSSINGKKSVAKHTSASNTILNIQQQSTLIWEINW